MKVRLVSWGSVWILSIVALVLIGLTVVVAINEAGKMQHAAPPAAAPEDWPTYLHDPQHTAMSGEKFLSTSNVAQLTKSWSFKTGDVVAPSPAVAGNTVYVGSWDGYEYALDAKTGAMKWKTYLGKTTPTPPCYPPYAGITSGAAVQNGVVYVGGGDAYWYALDAKTGKTLWKVYTGDNGVKAGHYNWSSALLYKGFAYIGIASFGDCPLVQGQVLKVSLSTHQIVNTVNLVPDGKIGAGVWDTPTVDPETNTLFLTTGTETDAGEKLAQALVAIDLATFTVKDSWKLPESEAVTDSDFGTTPTLFTDAAGDRLVVATNKNGYAYAFKRSNLSAGPVWQQHIALGGQCPVCGDGSISTGTFVKGTLYLAGGNTAIQGAGYPGSVRALDPATGKPLWEHGTSGPVLAALAYTNGLIIDGAGTTLEVLDASNGKRLYSYQTGGLIYGAPSISGGQIFLGSVDGNVYAFGLPSAPPARPPADSHCPKGWSCQDIGNPTPVGTETSSNTTWKVTAGGAGVTNGDDQFHLISQTVTGNAQITAQLVSQQSINSAVQTGLMIRQNNNPASPYYAVFFRKGGGIAVQYRSTFGGGTTTVAQNAQAALPLYLEIQRIGDLFQAATSTDGTTYTLVPGATTVLPMPAAVMVGLAASSGKNGASSLATLGAVTIGAPTTALRPVQSTRPCPAGWNCADVGNPLLGGGQSLSGGTWTIHAAGSDIWDPLDQFHYVWQSLPGNGSVSAQILTQTKTDPAAKAGVMLRAAPGPDSAYYAVFVTPGNGIEIQYRAIQGVGSEAIPSIPGVPPVYLRVTRSGNTFTAYTSTNGFTWTLLAGSSVTLNLPNTLLAGMAVTSHNGQALCTVTFDAVQIG
jgi:outer membrane protein assembly factor BamB